MDNEEDLIRRLHTLGTQPLEPAVSTQTLAAIRDAQRASIRRGTRLKVGLAAVAGFFIGGLGLASAGALPAGVQDVAQSVLERVGVDVPPGHERYNDPAVCPGGPYRNHGDYVRQHPDDPNAGASPCGKPVRAVDKSNRGNGTDPADPASDAPGKNSGKDKTADKGKSPTEDAASSAAESTSSDPAATDPAAADPAATDPAATESSDTNSSSSSDEQPTTSAADQSTASSS